MLLSNQNIQLRAIEPEDLEVLYHWENDTNLWTVGSTLAPYSKYLLREYIAEAHRDIYDVKQLRLVIELKSNQKAIGLIDLFDFDPHHKRAAIGVMIDSEFQGKSFGSQALGLIIEYAFSFLKLHQVFVHIPLTNKTSLHLFQKLGFKICGTFTDWLQTTDGYIDVNMLQLVNLKN